MILHKLSAKMCIKNAKWQNGELRCSKCKEPIAIRFKLGDKINVYIFRRFKKYQREIEQRQDTYETSSELDYMGVVSYREFQDLHNDLRYYSDYIYTSPEDGEGIPADSESEDSCELSGDNQSEGNEDQEEIATKAEFDSKFEEE